MAEMNITNNGEFSPRLGSNDNLIFWSVCVDQENVSCVPISDYFDDIEKARRALKAIKNTHGNAYIIERELFFNPNRSGDIERREKIASELR